jgi:hypothetical protein
MSDIDSHLPELVANGGPNVAVLTCRQPRGAFVPERLMTLICPIYKSSSARAMNKV